MDYHQIVCEALTLTSALACVFSLKNSEWTSGVTENLKLKQKWLKRLLPHLTSCFWSLIHEPLLFFLRKFYGQRLLAFLHFVMSPKLII